MRRWNLLICVGWLAATVAAPWLCAQNSGGQSTQNGAPVADQFVSTPGRMVSTPGQRVTGPGQMVMTPGQMVIPPAEMVVAPGQSISPVPEVIAPFHSPSQASQGPVQPPQMKKHGVTPGRRFRGRRPFRPEYRGAESYAVPYPVDNNYEMQAAAANDAGNVAGVTPRTMVRASPGSSGVGARSQGMSLADVPSGNRPAYRPDAETQPQTPSRAPNVIQSREPVLTLVMKNGDRRKVRNYALTPKTLIDLDEAASGKEVEIPLSKINVAATKKAAAQAGLSFAVPTS